MPVASVRARRSTIARTTSGSTGSPMPAAWEAMSDRWSRARCSGGIRTVARPPNPVEMPYTGSADAARASTWARVAAMAATASSDRRAAAPSRATASTSSRVRPSGRSTTDTAETVPRPVQTRVRYREDSRRGRP